MAERVTADQFRTAPAGAAPGPAKEARGYGAKGQAVPPGDPKCLAKAVPLPESGGANYYAVVSAASPRRLFDPMTDDPSGLGARDGSGFPKWRMERVEADAFAAYVTFLKNKNVALLRRANRDI